jgi:hypothetical protein
VNDGAAVQEPAIRLHPGATICHAVEAAPGPDSKSFFASFFSKKAALTCLS